MQDVIIRGNVGIKGNGDYTQSIFIQSNTPQFPNKNFLIEDNVILNNHLHGITLYDTIGVNIRHNTILAQDTTLTDGVYIPRINLNNCSRVEVSSNVATGFGTVDATNILAQVKNSEAPNYYGNLFENPFSGVNAKADDVRPKPDSILIVNPGRDIGALEYNIHQPNLTAIILTNINSPVTDISSGRIPLTVQLDGSQSGGPDEVVSYAWDFGDGQTGTGAIVHHVYASPNLYPVTLTVTDTAGHTATKVKDIIALPLPLGNLVLGLNMDGHTLDSSYSQIPCRWVGASRYDDGVQLRSISLDGTATGGYVMTQYHSSLDGMNALTLSFWAKKNDPLVGGFIFHKHVTYTLSIGADAIGAYLINNANTRMDISGKTATMNDAEWHHYALTYDGSVVKLFVDGQVIGSKPFTGSIAVHPDRAITIGKDPWGNAFNGTIDEVRIYKVAFTEKQINDLIANKLAVHTITATAGPGGRVDPSGAVLVEEGSPLGFSITPDSGFGISDVVADGASQGVLNQYTFPPVMNDHTLDVFFTPVSASPDSGGQFQIFKNVFNPLKDPPMLIRYYVSENTHITISIFDTKGQELKTIEDIDRPGGGIYEVPWNGRNSSGDVVASGVYLLKMKAGDQTNTKKVVVMK